MRSRAGSSVLLEGRSAARDPLIHASCSVFLFVALSCSRLPERSGPASVHLGSSHSPAGVMRSGKANFQDSINRTGPIILPRTIKNKAVWFLGMRRLVCN